MRTILQSTRFLALIVVLAIVAAACGSGLKSTDSDSTSNAALIAQGEELYQANCASCHGSDVRGTNEGPSFLSIVYEPNHHADAAFLLAAQNGVRAHHWNFGDMPPVEGVTPEDVAAIAAFVRETQRIEGFER